MSLDGYDEATKASEKTDGAIESTGTEEDLMGVVIVEDGNPPKHLSIKELDLSEDDSAHMRAEEEGAHPQSDTWVSLRPEGVAEPVALGKDISDSEIRRLIHTRFQEKVMLRTFVQGSVPDPRRRRTTRQQSLTVLGPATRFGPDQLRPPLNDEAEYRL